MMKRTRLGALAGLLAAGFAAPLPAAPLAHFRALHEFALTEGTEPSPPSTAKPAFAHSALLFVMRCRPAFTQRKSGEVPSRPSTAVNPMGPSIRWPSQLGSNETK